jgi:predicted MPP superfamily phosphohydrolase
MNRIWLILFFGILFLAIDYYVFQAIANITKNLSSAWKVGIRIAYWVPTVLSLAALLWWTFDDPYRVSANVRNWVITGLFSVYFSKIFAVLFLFVDDIQRGVRWAAGYFSKGSVGVLPGSPIPRSEFLSKAAVVAASIPMGAFAYGIISGAHDYRVRRITLRLKNLPKAFDGMRIGQISDIHSGSFWDKTAVKGGVDMLMKEKPEAIFFTGDLVNNQTKEVQDYFEIFSKLRAPLGVFSITGNHDYGDYHRWATQEDKKQNFKDLIEAHKLLGYDLLLNENRFIQIGADKIAVIGIENWGTRFQKYGKMDLAYKGTEDAPVKLLLSHDPTHWDAQVRMQYPDIDATFAGHTHGFQFGVEIPGFRWSPVQYVYNQWAGLYKEGDQYLYVNRGFGYLGYPGRVGMPPELTIFELRVA